jgi:hypothetical protein
MTDNARNFPVSNLQSSRRPRQDIGQGCHPPAKTHHHTGSQPASTTLWCKQHRHAPGFRSAPTTVWSAVTSSLLTESPPLVPFPGATRYWPSEDPVLFPSVAAERQRPSSTRLCHRLPLRTGGFRQREIPKPLAYARMPSSGPRLSPPAG